MERKSLPRIFFHTVENLKVALIELRYNDDKDLLLTNCYITSMLSNGPDIFFLLRVSTPHVWNHKGDINP